MANIAITDTDDQNESAESPENGQDEASAELKDEGGRDKSWKQWLETDDAVRKLSLIFGFCIIVLLMIMLQFRTQAICCGDWDGYYHIRWSALIWENLRHFKGLPDFTWLPLTVLNPQDYADHHFFFHLLQIPFLWFFKPVMAAKIASVFYGSLAIFSVYWLIYRYKVNYLLLWFAALVTCANPFWYRMNMAKAPPLTIIYSVLGIYLLFERKYVWLLPLMFFFVWTYSLFPLLFIAAMIWVAIIGWNEQKFEWQPLAYTIGGMLLGNVINPYFPNNIYLFLEHFFTKFRSEFDVAVGGEWYSYSGWQLVTHLSIALIAMLVGYILFKPKNGKLPEKATFFLVFGTLLLVWMFKSKRLAEYFPPFAILFAAFSWQAFTAPATVELPEEFQRDIDPLLDVSKEKGPVEYFQTFLPWLTGLILVLVFFFNFGGTRIFRIKLEDLFTSIEKNESADMYFEAMEWAKANIPEGERIFNSNWDDFPKLFFFDTKHNYVYGLDPNYLYSENPELSRLVRDITSGKTDDPAPIIREKFGARFIFADADENEDFIAKLLESGWAEIVHEDGEAYIIKIRDEKGEPPERNGAGSSIPQGAEQLDPEADGTENTVTDNAAEEDDEEVPAGEEDDDNGSSEIKEGTGE